MTQSEMIVLAALSLEHEDQSPFSASALVVAAWTLFPKVFGLEGFETAHPDSNRVLAGCMGRQGVAAKGWLVRMGSKRYALTAEGKAVARRLLGEPISEGPPVTIVALNQEESSWLERILKLDVFSKFARSKTRASYTFAEACEFWGANEELRGRDLTKHLERLSGDLIHLKEKIGSGHAVQVGDKMVVMADHVVTIAHLHEFLKKKFASVLMLLKHRSAQKAS